MHKDIEKLVSIWSDLHEIGGELKEIESRHPEVAGIHEVMETATTKLLDVAHMLINEARMLKKEEDDHESKENDG